MISDLEKVEPSAFARLLLEVQREADEAERRELRLAPLLRRTEKALVKLMAINGLAVEGLEKISKEGKAILVETNGAEHPQTDFWRDAMSQSLEDARKRIENLERSQCDLADRVLELEKRRRK